MTRQIVDAARDHGQMMMKRCGGRKIGSQLNVEPHIEVRSTLIHFEHSQTLADFSPGQHTQKQQ
jgi:hypothetical protein